MSNGREQRGNWDLSVFVGAFALVLGFAWITSDATFTERSVEQFLAGNGPNFNPDERVQVFSHPLWFLLLSALGFFRITFPASVIGLGLLLTFGTLWVARSALRSLSGSSIPFVLFAVLLLSSFSFVAFQTSGLENALTHFLLVWTLGALLSGRDRWSVFLAGLVVSNRMDQAPLVAPLLVLLFLRESRVSSFARAVGRFSVLLSPFLAWEAFSFVYYGFWVPNTAVAKLVSLRGLPWRGLVYVADWGRLETVPVVTATIAALSAAARAVGQIRSEGSTRLPAEAVLLLVSGALLEMAYVVSIGGDFMRGRFCLSSFVALAFAGSVGVSSFASRVAPSRPIGPRRGLALATVIFLALAVNDFHRSLDSPPRKGIGGVPGRWIANEWRVYRDEGTLFWSSSRPRWPVLRNPIPRDASRRMTFYIENGDPDVVYGVEAKFLMKKWGFISDPFAARIPTFYEWSNVGHVVKPVPTEYLVLEKAAVVPRYELVDRDRLNRLYAQYRFAPWRDRTLERLYFTIASITRDPLFSERRRRSIWSWWSGRWRTLPDEDLLELKRGIRPNW